MTIEITEKATIVKDFGSNLDQLLSELQIKQKMFDSFKPCKNWPKLF